MLRGSARGGGKLQVLGVHDKLVTVFDANSDASVDRDLVARSPNRGEHGIPIEVSTEYQNY